MPLSLTSIVDFIAKKIYSKVVWRSVCHAFEGAHQPGVSEPKMVAGIARHPMNPGDLTVYL
jgi:hypothetical protein